MAEKNTKKNIVFIELDQLGSKAIGAFGNDIVKTPNMDRLIDEGTCFDNFWCNSPLCGPARFSMFTGNMPFANYTGTRSAACLNLSYLDYMGDYFHNNDYSTFSIGKLHGSPNDFDFGFRNCIYNDVFESSKIEKKSYSGWLYEKMDKHTEKEKLREITDKHYKVGWYNLDRMLDDHYFLPNEFSERYWIAEETEDFLRKHKEDDRPFMMHVGINFPHPAWFVNPADDENIHPDEVSLPENFEPHWSTKPIPSNANAEPFMMEYTTKDWSEEDWKRWLAKYLTSVNMADKAVGEVIELIKRFGYEDDTVIMLSSDHGDMMGEFGLEAKYFFYNGSARLPMVIWGKDIPKGEHRTQIAEQIDIVPTLLDLAGAEVPERLDGNSFKNAIYKSDAITKTYSHGYLQFRGRLLTMTVSEKYKLCCYGLEYSSFTHKDLLIGYATELYDMLNDPNEYSNIFGIVNNDEIRELLKDHYEYFKRYNLHQGWIMTNDRKKAFHQYESREGKYIDNPLPFIPDFKID